MEYKGEYVYDEMGKWENSKMYGTYDFNTNMQGD